MKIKLATWNIGSLKRDYAVNLGILTQTLSFYCPDILVMQEFIENAELVAAVECATGLKLRYFKDFSESHIAAGERMGVAVFARRQVAQKAEYALIKPNRAFYYKNRAEYFHDKYFMSLEADDAKGIVFLTGHGFSFNRYGENPADFPQVFAPLDEFLCGQKGRYTVAIGDFNAENACSLLPKTCTGLTDVYDGVETRPNGRKTDYVIIPNEFKSADTVNIRLGRYDPDEGFDHNYLQTTVEYDV